MEKDCKIGCAIVANGAFPQDESVLAVLRSAQYICCCDGAVEKLLRFGLEPDVIVGDCDSLSEQLRQKYSSIVVCFAEQETNDLTKATKYCVEQGYKKIYYFGATGLREDHTLGNIFLLPYYAKEFDIEPIMLTDEGRFVVCCGDNNFETKVGQTVSVFNVSCQKRLISNGLK